MNLDILYKKALNLEELNIAESLFIYDKADNSDLFFVANELRKKHNPNNFVGWIIDRNVNITNVCYAGCEFCNFSTKVNSQNAFITSQQEYRKKIKELFDLGGNQLLLQGGMHPKLGLNFYKELFENLKKEFPKLLLHSLSPTEIVHIARKEKLTYTKVLEELVKSGLDSLPGAGAEILVDRVRKQISKYKCTAQEWLGVMKAAHSLNIPTSATMMIGHIETQRERIVHLIKLRELQKQKKAENYGFITFVPWTFQDKDTKLSQNKNIKKANKNDYLRLIAISRIILNNIKNIQVSWLTAGKEIAQLALYTGANDMGSIMIEENVVSAAGSHNSMNSNDIQQAIIEAGFVPQKRNQKYEAPN